MCLIFWGRVSMGRSSWICLLFMVFGVIFFINLVLWNLIGIELSRVLILSVVWCGGVNSGVRVW